MGGALKNVLAIACGISDGLGFGNNGRAALITRGLAEMTRLVGHPVSVATLLGSDEYCSIVHARRPDAVVTCYMSWSRRMTSTQLHARAHLPLQLFEVFCSKR